MNRIVILIGLLVTCSLLVFTVGFIARDRSKYHNDFVRILPPHAADPGTRVKITTHRFNLVGLTKKYAYLQDKHGMLRVNLELNDTMRFPMDLPIGAELAVDSPYFFIKNRIAGSLQRGTLKSLTKEFTLDSIPNYTAIQPISPTTAILRTMDIGERQNILVKSNRTQKYVLQKQVDGLLCTDGYLQYAKELKQVVYTYRYRNQFICLDTNLSVVRIGKTIDTTSVAKISVMETDGRITMSKPPLVVNVGACVDGKYLFVQSNLVAKNESSDHVKNRSAIDVYHIPDGSYRFSFYLDNYGGKRLHDFKVNGTVLVATFSDAVIRYDLPSQYLP